MFYKYYLKIKSRFFYNFMYLNIVTDPSKPDYLKRDHILKQNYFFRYFSKKKRDDLKKDYWNNYYLKMTPEIVNQYLQQKLISDYNLTIIDELVNFSNYRNILEMSCGVAGTTISIKKKYPNQNYFICDAPKPLISLLKKIDIYSNINLYQKSFYDDFNHLTDNNINLIIIENSVYLFELKPFVKFLKRIKKQNITFVFSIFDNEYNFYRRKIYNLLQVFKTFYVKENYIVEGRRYNTNFYKDLLKSENINFKLKQIEHKIYFCVNF